MNSTIIQGNWTELKGKIKTQWAKFTDDDVEALKGNLEQLSGKIQKVYGYGKEQAEREFNEFKNTMASKMDGAVVTPILEKADALETEKHSEKQPEKQDDITPKAN